MTSRTDLGMQAVKIIADIWQVDNSRTIWLENGFDWWPGHFRLSLRVSEPIQDMDADAFRLSAVTEVLVDAPVNRPECLGAIDALARFAPTYAYRQFPSTASEKSDVLQYDGTLSFCSTAYLYADNLNWLPRFFSALAILQPIDAESRAESIVNLIGGTKSTSSPDENDTLVEVDEMLEVAGSSAFHPTSPITLILDG